jgi:hypothetical protein
MPYWIFHFFSLHFVLEKIRFVSFRLISFRSVSFLFRFALYRYPLRQSRKLHPRNFTTAYININSMRNKYDEIKELLSDKIVDLLFIAETKLDQSFKGTTKQSPEA